MEYKKYFGKLKVDHTSNDARRVNVRDSSPLPVPSQSDWLSLHYLWIFGSRLTSVVGSDLGWFYLSSKKTLRPNIFTLLFLKENGSERNKSYSNRMDVMVGHTTPPKVNNEKQVNCESQTKKSNSKKN